MGGSNNGVRGRARRRHGRLLTLLGAAAASLLVVSVAAAVEYPQPTGGVNDPTFEVEGNLEALDADVGVLDWFDPDDPTDTGLGVITGVVRNADGSCTDTTLELGTPGNVGSGVLICDGSAGAGDETNVFTGGSKEEPGVWDIVDMSAPKKGDLAEVYLYAKLADSPFDPDTDADDLFFFADMTRLDVNGSTYADFEFNQLPQDDCGDTDADTFCQTRTDGDVIVSFNLSQGGNNPQIKIFEFDHPDGDEDLPQACANAPQISFSPDGCYKEHVGTPQAPGSGILAAEAFLNAVEIPAASWQSVGCERTSDDNSTGCKLRDNIPAKGNMEGFVDITAFLGDDVDLCPGFGQMTVKTRSSDALNSELKDTTAPEPINVSLCGSILIEKVDGAGNALAGAEFTISPDPVDGEGVLVVTDGDSDDDDPRDGFVCINQALFDDYTVTESDPPDGYFGDPDSESVSVTAASTCEERAGEDPPDDPDASFENLQGSLLIEKTDADGNPIAGAGFTITPNPFTGAATGVEVDDGEAGVDQASADGLICIDNVRPSPEGGYTISETTVPPGYFGSDDDQTADVLAPSTCAARLLAEDTPDASFPNYKGSIIIRKVDGAGNLLPGASFTVSPDPLDGDGDLEVADGGANDATSADDGIVCIDGVLNLDGGTYDVTETGVPSGFFGDADTVTVTVDTASTCLERGAAGENYDPELVADEEIDAEFENLKGSILIVKTDQSGALLGDATFGISPNPLDSDPAADDPLLVQDDDANDASDVDGVICVDNVRNLGTGNDYTVTEEAAPDGYFGDSDSVTVGVHAPSSCADRLEGLTTVGGYLGESDADFENGLGTILIEKLRKNASAEGGEDRLGGATFRITPHPFDPDDVNGYLDVTDDDGNDSFSDDGLLCVDGVRDLGDGNSYSIVELESFTAYTEDPDTENVAVTAASTCTVRGTADEADAVFVNVPLSAITVDFDSLAGAGVTIASIQCTGSGGGVVLPTPLDPTPDPLVLDDDVETITGLAEGTYVCTIVVDP